MTEPEKVTINGVPFCCWSTAQAIVRERDDLARKLKLLSDGSVTVAGVSVPVVKPIADMIFKHYLTDAFGLTSPGVLSISDKKLLEHAANLRHECSQLLLFYLECKGLIEKIEADAIMEAKREG